METNPHPRRRKLQRAGAGPHGAPRPSSSTSWCNPELRHSEPAAPLETAAESNLAEVANRPGPRNARSQVSARCQQHAAREEVCGELGPASCSRDISA